MTFSIVARDPKTGMMGIAVATKHLAVGALVPHAKAGIGAIATQAQTNPLLGIRGLRMLERRVATESIFDETPADAVIHLLLDHDEDRHQRQVHLVDHNGHTAAWTGRDCTDWAGHLSFPNFSVAGNMLVCGLTLEAMVDTYRASSEVEFCDRLIRTLEAGEAAGGDKRGRQSAALYVVHSEVYPYLDLRVDHHTNPVAELRYLFEESRKDYYQSFRSTMPSHAQRPRVMEPTWLTRAV
ncbi:DUF1028 domain-containing protein [filamentous cyanobacterium CCP5]|nr:DUF1028 domain-containing protein [filamentous cyanobacterium CCP5]